MTVKGGTTDLTVLDGMTGITMSTRRMAKAKRMGCEMWLGIREETAAVIPWVRLSSMSNVCPPDTWTNYHTFIETET